MKHNKIIAEVFLFIVVFDMGLLLDTKKDLTRTSVQNVNSSHPSSHEELHSLKNNLTSLNLTSNSTKVIGVSDLNHQYNSNSTLSLNHSSNNTLLTQKLMPTTPKLTPAPSSPTKSKTLVVAEGGIEVSTTMDYIRITSNEKYKNATNTSLTISTTALTNKSDATGTNESKLITPGVDDKPIHKRIHGRPGVSMFPNASVSINLNNSITTLATPTTTVHLRKKKPLFTMITGDKESKESESFIESPTTGRDYVLHIVLIILSLPILGYLIKIIYRRGTEFTERQQYHRMYLIDGMYNSR